MDSNQTTAPLSEPALVEAVRKQIEYYFSKENLQSDVYLTSQMDAQMSVPIPVVMKFAKLKALTQDEGIVRQALKDSTAVQLVENRIKPVIKAGSGRSTLILREIPSDAPEEEVREIFNYTGCKPIISIRSEIGDTWFVMMETEEDAKDTCLDLRLKKRTFRNLPVKARIKTEPVVRSYFPVPPAIPQFPILPFPVVPVDLSNYGYIANTQVDAGIANSNSDVTSTAENQELSNDDNEKVAEDGTDAKGIAAARKDTRKPSSSRPVREETRRKPEPRKSSTPTHTFKDKEKKPDVPVAKPPIEVNAMTFPPLLGMEDTPVPALGYQSEYLKYSFDQIITIVKNVKEAVLPATLLTTEHSLAMTSQPNMDLLKRQRTFSIDETREQLRQGRPVQREAIISGAVDYKSLMYGDDHELMKEKNISKVVDAPSSSGAIGGQLEDEQIVKSLDEKCSISNEKSSSQTQSTEPPTSPQRISASTWAAMVKSSAEISALANTTTTTVAKPVTKPPAVDPVEKKNLSKPVDGVEKAEKNQAIPNKRQEKEKNDKDRRTNRSEKKKFREGDEGSKFAKSESTIHNEKDGSDAKNNDQSHSSQGTGVWGKSTFASVLKQTLPDDVVAEETKKPTNTISEQKPLKQNSRGNALKGDGSESRHYQRGPRRRDDAPRKYNQRPQSENPEERNQATEN